MTLPMAAWRVSYTPGNWLVLSGPTTLVVLAPVQPRKARLINQLWTDVVAASSVTKLLELLSATGLSELPDFAAFHWDASGLHCFLRGGLQVVDIDTGDVAVSGSDVVTWREEKLGAARRLRLDMEPKEGEAGLALPLVVGAVSAAAIFLTTADSELIRFVDPLDRGVLPKVPVLADRAGLASSADAAPVSKLRPVHSSEPSLPEPGISASQFAPPPAKHLASQPAAAATGDEIMAAMCHRGHANPPSNRHCRLCRGPVDPATAKLVPRPTLAGVATNRGEFTNLQVPVVFGRSPKHDGVPAGARLKAVASPTKDISRNHLLLTAKDWDVVVTDLNSTNGTTVKPPSGQPFILSDGKTVKIELGTILELGDGVALRLEPPRED